MRIHRLVTLLGPCALLILVQFLGALVNTLAGLLAGLAVGALALFLEKVLELLFEPWWWLEVAVFSSSALGIAGALFTRHSMEHALILLLAPLLAGGLVSLGHMMRTEESRRCELCSHGLRGDAFDCPRCGLLVCESCWNSDGSRCRQCQDNRVPILNMDRAWWERHLGPRIRRGRCQLCLNPAENTDLRTCQQCGRPYCRKCWDSANGQCGSCGWSIPGLPDRLRKYLPRQEMPARSGRAGRASQRRTY